MNIIFGEVVKLKLVERGKSLSKDKLQETDQDLHEAILDEYNLGKLAYGSHAFSNIADFQDELASNTYLAVFVGSQTISSRS